MPSLIDLRRRIRSVKNTQQITKAMKMVSTARLRRAQDMVLSARPYAQLLRRMLQNVAAVAGNDDEAASNPLLARRPENRILILVLTGDRGLAGAFNATVIKTTQKFIADHEGARIELELMGRKGRDFFRKRWQYVSGEYGTLFLRTVNLEDALAIARKAIDRFRKEEIDAVYIIGNEFKSIASQIVTTTRLLPVDLPEAKERVDYIYEQPPSQLLASLLPKYVETSVYTAMLESSASEHATRMRAMDAASTNAADVIEKYTMTLNRVRQASITKEIIEIVSGAAALG
jgi:F-type H+-transporting ATPase subunit gamma